VFSIECRGAPRTKGGGENRGLGHLEDSLIT